MSDHQTLSVKVWRGGEAGHFDTFSVPARDNQTILDVVTYIQRNLDAGLSYRFACRVGVCGSCAMTVNGTPRWTCRTHVKTVSENNQLTIEPLRNLPRIKDLACDMTPFFEKWQKAGGVFRGKAGRHEPMASISPESRKRKAANQAIECINCGVCYSACDVVSWNPDYLGPAALNRAWTLVNDERQQNRREQLRALGEKGGCGACHVQGKCADACPVELSPTRSISGLKRMSLLDFLGLGKL